MLLVSPLSTSPYAFGASVIPLLGYPSINRHTDMSTTIKQFSFTTAEKKIERTFFVEGKVTFAQDYETSNGLQGIAFEIEGIPYKLRVLNGSIKGGSNASHFIGCTVKFTGVDRDYDGKKYFSPKDAVITKESALAKLSKAGVAYAGSLD